MVNRHLRSRRTITTKLDVASGGGDVECSPISKRKREQEEEEPFWKLFLKVGMCVACFFALVLYVYHRWLLLEAPVKNIYDDDDFGAPSEALLDNTEEEAEGPLFATDPPTRAPRQWTLGQQSQQDAFSHAQSSSESLFWQAAQGLRNQFSDLYGGETAARHILETTTIIFNVSHTACRLQLAREQERPFTMSFGGYSVTTGRGNYHLQSYPNVLERKLSTIFELAGLSLKVRNAAIGGVPSFPYGWCMDNFFGQADVISWDFSMNEAGGDPTGLEAYLRQATARTHPMLIIKDTHMALQRHELVKRYQPILLDPIILYTDPGTEYFLNLPEDERPIGFREWRKFGAPLGAPGQSAHHPGVHEHEFIAWILAMHFLNALEILQASPEKLSCLSTPEPLTEPIHSPNATMSAWPSIFYGEKSDDTWHMNTVSCRTSFEPLVRGNLSDIVVKGGVGEDLDVMLPKSKMYYNDGWVLDLSDREKKVKRNLDRFGGLGFVDSKRAYYGIFASGTLSLFLPYEEKLSNPIFLSKASNYFKSIVVCEVNEMRDSSACNTMRDVYYTVGGVNATFSPVDSGGTMYLGKKICMHIKVPESATLACAKPNKFQGYSLVEIEGTCNDQIGVTLEVQVHNGHINRREDACSVSHVVWEQVHPALQTKQ